MQWCRFGPFFSESKARPVLNIANVSKEGELLGERFSRPKVVPRTQNYHYAEVVGAGRIAVRCTSVSNKQEEFIVDAD